MAEKFSRTRVIEKVVFNKELPVVDIAFHQET